MSEIFVSYSWKQSAWVWDRLVPVLAAAGVDVLIDRERFVAGKDVVGQMDATQDLAGRNVLCLSSDYLAGAACRHEMKRAIAADPNFRGGKVIPLRLDAAPLPKELTGKWLTTPKPLWIDFIDDRKPSPWDELLKACDADLGITAPRWLDTRDQALTFLGRDEPQSVNLVVRAPRARWKGLLTDVMQRLSRRVPWIDLEDGATTTRPDFLNEILAGLGISREIREGHDLVDFSRIIRGEKHAAFVALVHFERIERFRDDIDLSAAFRNLIMEHRKLVLLVQSRDPFAKILPEGHRLSDIDIKTIELA